MIRGLLIAGLSAFLMLFVLSTVPAYAASTLTLSFQEASDFVLYLSSSDATAGTQLVHGSWQGRDGTTPPGASNTYYYTVSLTSGVTNYVHVMVYPYGQPDGGYPALIGQFSLGSQSGFQFANGTSTIFTDPAWWTVSYSGWGQNEGATATWVSTGTSNNYEWLVTQTAVPYNTNPSLGAIGITGAQYLGSNGFQVAPGSSDYMYFSMPIYLAPEPGTLFLVLGMIFGGFLLLGGCRRRQTE